MHFIKSVLYKYIYTIQILYLCSIYVCMNSSRVYHTIVYIYSILVFKYNINKLITHW